MRNKDKIAEGYYPMGKSRSYSDAVPSVKIVIEHSRVIEEGEQRYRNINRIFLENQDGERYLLDTKKPGIARVYARHIAEGGKVNDDRWSHIGNLCEEYQKMAGFVRATRNGQFNESAQALVNEGLEHYQSLRESLSRMTGKRGYNAYFESWTPPLMEDGTEENNLNELFVQETLDPRIESVMPILNRIHKKVSESIVDKEMNKLAEWADSLVEEESIKSNNPGGIPESETPTHKGGTVTSKNGVTQHKSGPGVYGGFDASRHPDSPEEKHVDSRGATTGHRTDKVVKHKDMEEAITPGASFKRFEKDRFGNQNLPAKPTSNLDEVGDTPAGLAAVQKVGQRADRALGDAGTGYANSEVDNIDKTYAAKDRANSIVNRERIRANDKNPTRVVGANENFINMDAQAVTSEGEHTQHAMRGRNPGANEFEHDFENDKIDNIHDKISKMLKRLEKPEHEPNMKDTDLGSTVLESHQLNEGLMDSLNGMIAKIKAMPGIQKYIQMAQSKKAELTQALQHSANGKDLVANIQQAVGGQQAVAEGLGQKIGGAVAASAGGGLLAGAADIMMRAYIAMGKPDLTQMMNDPNGKNALVLVSMLVVLGALAMFAGGHQVKQGMDNDIGQQMREGQEDFDAILRIIRK